MRAILAAAVKPENRVQLGDALASLSQKVGLTNEDFVVFDAFRDKKPAEPLGFK